MMNEFRTLEGQIAEVEVNKAVFTGIESRKGNIGDQVSRVDEWRDMNGNIQEVEISFLNGMKVVYKGNIQRKGNL